MRAVTTLSCLGSCLGSCLLAQERCPLAEGCVDRVALPNCVETNQQAQAPGQEEGQPRQEAELRARLTAAPLGTVTTVAPLVLVCFIGRDRSLL